MKFSIIIPTLNANQKLHITLDSLVSQTYREFECIIMDAVSMDATSETVNSYRGKIPNLHFFSKADEGIYDAMNHGVLHADGDYILFLGAGDSLSDSHTLEQIYTHLSKHPCDILYGDICFLPHRVVKQPDMLTNRYFRSGNMICHQSVIAKKSCLTVYPFCTDFTFGADRDWLIFHLKNHAVFSHIPLIIANYDTTGFSGKPENQKAVWMESGEILKRYFGPIMVPVTKLKYYLIIKWRLRRQYKSASKSGGQKRNTQ